MSSLSECDGTPVLRTECLLQADTTDLTFCECQLCQVYTQRTHTSPSSPLANEMATTHLQPGIESNHTLCLNHWMFFRIDTAPPGYVQSWQDPDVFGERSSINAQQGSLASTPQQVVLTLDTTYDATYERYTTVDAFLHLASWLPNNWYTVHSPPYPQAVFTPGEPPDTTRYVGFDQVDSFTYTIGYDELAASCQSETMPTHFYMGVRCGNPTTSQGSWVRQDTPCSFRVRYVLIPQHLEGGDVLGPLPIAPSTTHAFSVLVGSYDVIRFAVRRVGDNLTYSCRDQGASCLTNGHGLVGQVYYAVNMCPTRQGGSVKLLSNDTETLRQEWFCTAPGDEGRYFIAVRAGALFDASGPVPGYVLENGRRPTDALVPLPGQPLNRLKPARGYYAISVLHRAFLDGPISPGEVRQGCVSYGQMRRFTIVTTGPRDASLYLNVTEAASFGGLIASAADPADADVVRPALSSVFVRRNRAPTMELYDVAVHAPEVALSTSPCYVDEPYEYHIATYLAGPMRANADGLRPTLFELRPRLLTALGPTYGTRQWPRPGRTIPLVTPLSEGGGGHICCSQFRYFVLRNIPPDQEPVVIINVTAARRITRLESPPPPPAVATNSSSDGSSEAATGMGSGTSPAVMAHVQALFLKRHTHAGSCPSVADVLPDRSQGCMPEAGQEYSRCRIAWLVHTNHYSGGQTFMSSTVGTGGFAPLAAEAAPSDWYVGVQALHDEPAEFTLRLASRRRPPLYEKFACNRLLHFCPTDVPFYIDAIENSTAEGTSAGDSASSAAAPRWAGGDAATWAGMLLAWAFVLLAPWQHGASHGGRVRGGRVRL